MDHVRTLFEALYIDFDRVMTSHPHMALRRDQTADADRAGAGA